MLDAETRTLMETPRGGRSYACGWSTSPIHGRACIAHSGGSNGYVANLPRFPDDDADVVVMSNLAYAPITRIARDVTAILFGADFDAPRVATADELDAACGVYAGTGTNRVLVRRSGGLLTMFRMGPGRRRLIAGRTLVPVGDAEFAEPFGSGPIRFSGDRMVLPSGVVAQELTRVADVRSDWLARTGAYESSQARGAVLDVRDEELWFDTAAMRRSCAVAPVAADLALVLISDLGGRRLRARSDSLEWERFDGVTKLRRSND